ncbi:MAG: hypothetical protein FJ276_12115 [Planctomycetes bacterium]|nr:hypothetical protein [Planctomycetota bacterium]
MWRRTAWIIALAAAVATGRRSWGQVTADSEPLLLRANWVRFDVVLGRILATAHRATQNQHRVQCEHACGAAETLVINIDRGLISLQYAKRSDREDLRVEVARRDQLRVEWTRRPDNGPPTTVIYDQGVAGDVSLIVRSPGEADRAFQSTSLWHLMLIHRRVCEEHLAGILELLRPGWDLGREAAEVRSSLLDPEQLRHAVSRQEVAMAVDQLAEDQYQARQQAHRQLRRWGRSAVCFLDELDLRQLDAEQRLHVESIRAAIKAEGDDSRQRVAAWLANDMEIWVAMLADEDGQHRQTARQRVARLANRLIVFDPTAPPNVRGQQVAALRAELLVR